MENRLVKVIRLNSFLKVHWSPPVVNTGIRNGKHVPDAKESRYLRLRLQKRAHTYAKTSACATASNVFHELTTHKSRICISFT